MHVIQMISLIIFASKSEYGGIDGGDHDDGEAHLEALHQLVVTHQVMEKPLYMEYNLYNVTL